MILCNNVKFTCCTKLDELKYHNNWNSYYQPKIGKIFEKINTLLQDLNEILSFFKEFDFALNKKYILEENHNKFQLILTYMRQMKLESTEEMSLNLEKITSIEINKKQEFLCNICDYRNHLKFSKLD